MSTDTKTAPEGFRCNARGDLIHIDNIKEVDLHRDEIVTELMIEAKKIGKLVAEFKKKALDTIESFSELSADTYGAKRGGLKGNITLTSFDGSARVVRRMADKICFDERLQAAEALITECLEEWTEDARAELRTIAQNAFKTDKNGNLSVGKVLGLRSYKFTDPKWLQAMEAISDSITITGTKAYVCFYDRCGSGDYVQISLDPTEL